MTTKDLKLTNLDFYFIREIKGDVYEIIYARDIVEEDAKGEVLYAYDEVAFWSEENCDHRMVVSFNDILLKGLIF